ncbi:helix-turn-helix domain-containing protein [Epibacterium ulvae]|uniref:XRE family transcriptional regulator n=1 Tax=Epibacterium ulvae TaxID=1156985 RepID=UPI001BFC6897|nr:helix-turn-helix domain-containing protein [Epibacterium ulvae]MBT8152736.1 helix-turn-helix domain-containing protein [Epibacterium ulvae]
MVRNFTHSEFLQQVKFHNQSMEWSPGIRQTCGMKFLIREKRLAAGLTQEALADRLGISVSLFNGLETGKRRVNETHLEGLSSVLGMPVSELIDEKRPTVVLAGEVRAGAEVAFSASGDGSRVECPPGLPSPKMLAVLVEGDGMEPVYSRGDVLFYARDEHEGVPRSAIGHKCVCEDEDGVGWVKQVREGSEPGLFHLISLNPFAQNNLNVRLKWAARMRLHWPADLVTKV